MASSDRIVANQEQLVGGDGTVAVALQLWCSRNGLVMYSQWQSLYFHLVRAGFEDEKQLKVRAPKISRPRSPDCSEKSKKIFMGPTTWRQQLLSPIIRKRRLSQRQQPGGGSRFLTE